MEKFQLVSICGEEELPAEGEVREVAGGRLCVARIGGEIAVMDNACPHNGGPLGRGVVENGRVVCPLHGWAFDGKTGAAKHSPAAMVRIHEAVVRDGALLIRQPERRDSRWSRIKRFWDRL